MKKFIHSKWLLLSILLFFPILLAGCGNSSNTVKVGVVGADNAKLWTELGQQLKNEGVNLKVVTFNDYNQPNLALKQKEIDINNYQNLVFLSNWNKSSHSNIVSIGKAYFPPMAIYSNKIKNLNEIQSGSKVTLPNDVANEARGLKLLASAGLIKLNNNPLPTVKDVIQNKHNLKFTPVDASQVPRTLSDVQLAVANSNFAIDANLNPKKALYTEKFNKSADKYVNIIATNKDEKNNKIYKKVVKAYQSSENEKRILKVYKGANIPAWNH